MEDFEVLLCDNRGAVERFVYFRISNQDDAEDILQEIYLTAFEKFSALKNPNSFKAWLLSIARNKCNDYFRQQAKLPAQLNEESGEIAFVQSRYGIAEQSDVTDVLAMLKKQEKEILYLYYFCDFAQTEIARRLHIPLGTVKSRLYHAKQSFKERYPYTAEKTKGVQTMTKLPEYLPDYKIIKSDKEPFAVCWEELMGWLIVPRLGEKLSWAMYDFPHRKRTETVQMEVIGKAEVHGIEGVEITAKEYQPMDCNALDHPSTAQRRFVAQLTDTHCRLLAESHQQNGVNKYYTFLDGDVFLDNWGFGDENCGKETNISAKHRITKDGSRVACDCNKCCMDVVGRYTVIIGNQEFDTICLMDIESYDTGVVTEQYIDAHGKTVLWRRFNADDWAFSRYGQAWSKQLPQNEQITVNGKVYVHWYDCISDYIL